MLHKVISKPSWYVVLLLFAPFASFSQQKVSLSLNDAIERYKNHSSSLKSDSIDMLLSRNKIKQNSNGFLPQLSVSSTYQRLSGNIQEFAIATPGGNFVINPQILSQSYNTLQLQQLLYAGGKVRKLQNALIKESIASELDYSNSRRISKETVTELWYRLYNAKAAEKIITANISSLTGKRDDQRKFVDQGIILENDVLRIELSITELQSSLSDVAALSSTLNHSLAMLTGLGEGIKIEIPEEYILPDLSTSTLDEYQKNAGQTRPEIKANDLRISASNFKIKASKADYFPTLSLIGSYNYDRPNQRVIPNVDRFDYSALAGLTLRWNVSSLYTNRSNVNSASLIETQLIERGKEIRENINIEVNNRYVEFNKTVEKLALVEKQLIQATENYRVEQNKLKAQTTTPTDFLNANNVLLQAQLNLSTAKANVALAHSKLLSSIGTNN